MTGADTGRPVAVRVNVGSSSITPSSVLSDPSKTMLLIDWLGEIALPLWWNKGADHELGGFFEALDAQGAPVLGPRRARVIARQIYVYCAAHWEGVPGPWAEAAAHGLRFMLDRFMRPDGLIRAYVGVDGQPIDDTVVLYDQGFCLFALASAARAGLGGDDLLARADRLLDVLERDWSAQAGGFVEQGRRTHQSNPHMHLLEAALALEAAGAGPRYAALADGIADLCLSRFIDARSGALREFFSPDWSPAPGEDGRIVEPGHQFEWAWLLSIWSRLRGRADAASAAARLYAVADSYGIDRERGVVIDQLSQDFTVVSARARLWPQTERIKAAAILAQGCDSPTLRAAREADMAQAVRGLKTYLTVPASGLWRDKMLEDGRFTDEPSPASSFYHIALAVFDARSRGFVI